MRRNRDQHNKKNLNADESGVTAVEFAFIAPPLFLLILGVIEIGLLTLAASTLEAANNVTSRTGATGYVGAGLTREQTIRAEIERSAAPFLDPELVTISTLTYATFDQVGQPEPWNDVDADNFPDPGEFTDVNGNGLYDTDMGAVGAGGGGSVVVYTVSYPWQMMTPIVGQIFGEDGVVTLTSRAVVKNEPF
jgi:Flp pilus assembly protein TadG